MAWARATKGSAAYAILGVDPKTGGNPRRLYQSDGAVAPADIAPDSARLIFVRSLSNREDQLFELPQGTVADTVAAAEAPAEEAGVAVLPGATLQEIPEIIGVGEIVGLAVAALVLVVTLGSVVAAGLPQHVAELLTTFEVGYRQGALSMVTNAVEELWGEKPPKLRDFLAANRAALGA